MFKDKQANNLTVEQASKILDFFGSHRVKQTVKRDSFFVEYTEENSDVKVVEGVIATDVGVFASDGSEALIKAAVKLQNACKVRKIIFGESINLYKWQDGNFILLDEYKALIK